jgi:NitT/TauT family transport system permease protein
VLAREESTVNAKDSTGHRDGVTNPQGTAHVAPETAGTPNFLKRDIIANAIIVVLILFSMEAWSWFVPDYIMPSVALSAEYTATILVEDYFHILLTMFRLFFAVIFALVVGSLLGALMGMVKPIAPFIKAVVVIDTGVPALSWMLFAVFWFKEPEARVFFILGMVLVPFYALNVYDGIRALSTDLIELVETFRPSRWQVFKLLILPHMVPYILMTTKSIIGYATRMTVFAELVSVSTGMGARMGLAQNNFEMEGVIAWTALLVILNLSVQGLVALIEKSLLKWRPEVSVR